MNRKNRREVNAVGALVAGKVFVSGQRLTVLKSMQKEVASASVEEPPGPDGAPLELLCFNLDAPILDALRKSLPEKVFRVQELHFFSEGNEAKKKEDDKRFCGLFKQVAKCSRLRKPTDAKANTPAPTYGAVILKLSAPEQQAVDDELAFFDKRVIAMALLNKLPVLCTSTSSNALRAVDKYIAKSWPTFLMPKSQNELVQWVREQVPAVHRLARAIQADLHERTKHHKHVNIPWHFVSRASVALVPCGVAAVNSLGHLYLMNGIMRDAGMRPETINALTDYATNLSSTMNTAVEYIADIYSYSIFAMVLADFSYLALVESLQALSVLDGLALGSVSLVTGAISAVCAALTRPQMVRSCAEFLAALQLLYVVSPFMRRPGSGSIGGMGGASLERSLPVNAKSSIKEARKAVADGEKEYAAKKASRLGGMEGGLWKGLTQPASAPAPVMAGGGPAGVAKPGFFRKVSSALLGRTAGAGAGTSSSSAGGGGAAEMQQPLLQPLEEPEEEQQRKQWRLDLQVHLMGAVANQECKAFEGDSTLDGLWGFLEHKGAPCVQVPEAEEDAGWAVKQWEAAEQQAVARPAKVPAAPAVRGPMTEGLLEMQRSRILLYSVGSHGAGTGMDTARVGPLTAWLLAAAKSASAEATAEAA